MYKYSLKNFYYMIKKIHPTYLGEIQIIHMYCTTPTHVAEIKLTKYNTLGTSNTRYVLILTSVTSMRKLLSKESIKIRQLSMQVDANRFYHYLTST